MGRATQCEKNLLNVQSLQRQSSFLYSLRCIFSSSLLLSPVWLKHSNEEKAVDREDHADGRFDKIIKGINVIRYVAQASERKKSFMPKRKVKAEISVNKIASEDSGVVCDVVVVEVEGDEVVRVSVVVVVQESVRGGGAKSVEPRQQYVAERLGARGCRPSSCLQPSGRMHSIISP